VTCILGEISKHFGKIGDNHQFLEMDIHLNKNETVSLSMQAHVKKAIEAYGDDVSIKIATPAERNLFSIDDESEELEEDRSVIFHLDMERVIGHRKKGFIFYTYMCICST